MQNPSSVTNEEEESPPSDPDRKNMHKKVLMQIQSIFSHLTDSRLQFHIPKGFWRDFRYIDFCTGVH